MRLLPVLCLFVMAALPAEAATLSRSTDADCMARFEGRIETGDLERFKAAAPGLLIPSNSEEGTGDVTICLDSPGGSLLEATRIAAYVEEQRIGTVIDDGDACLSACSIIFMLGTQAYVEDFGFNRKMHVNATLGFHRPAFSLPEGGGYSSADVEKAFNIAIQATLEFVRLANRRQNMEDSPMILSDLMEEMFAHEGQDFFFIDTVDKAGRWQIGVFGYDKPMQISGREALMACNSLSDWTKGRVHVAGAEASVATPSDDVDWLAEQVRRVRHDDHDEVVWEVVGTVDGMGDRWCQVAMTEGQLMACGGDLYSSRPVGQSCGPGEGGKVMEANALAIFDPDTPLPDLPGTAVRVAAQAKGIEARLDGAMPQSCSVLDMPGVRVVGVENFLNIRSRPAFDAAVLAQAPLYQALESGGEGWRLEGDFNRQQDCHAACEGYMTWSRRGQDRAGWLRDRSTVAQCLDGNVIWWNVTLPDGRSGWASAKYLR